MLVPTSATLLSAKASDKVDSSHPPMFARLTPEALESLKQKSNGRILLQVDGRSGQLAVNGQTIDISVADEPGTLQVFTAIPSARDQFQCVGLVKKRLTFRKSLSPGPLSPPAATPQLSSAGNRSPSVDTPPAQAAAPPASKSRQSRATAKPPTPPRSPRELLADAALLSSPMRVAHLLALAPASSSSLSERTQVPVAEVQSFVQQIARPASPAASGASDLFILRNESYEHLRIFEWKQYSVKERQKVLANAQSAYAALNYPPDHPARSNLKDPRRRTASVSPERRAAKRKSAALSTSPAPQTLVQTPPTSASPPNSTSSSSTTAKPATNVVTNSTVNSAVNTSTKSSVNATNLVGPPEKRLKPTTEEDLFTLARRFKATYSEYSRLYGALSSGPRPESQVKKLLTMHKNLESWKQRLWSASKRRGRQVPSK